MAYQAVGIGSAANDGTGDPLRTAFTKINANFVEVYGTHSDALIASLVALTTAADKGLYFTGSNVAATYDLTSFARTLLDDADAATMRTTLGLVIGTNVQAYDADLASWAGVTRASGFDTFAATPSSANLAALITDEVGSTALAFQSSGTTTPTVTAASGTFTSVSCTLKWQRTGDKMHVEAEVTITTNGTAAAAVIVPLPVAAVNNPTGVGRERGVTGNMVQAEIAGANAFLRTYANAYPGGTGHIINFTVDYIV